MPCSLVHGPWSAAAGTRGRRGCELPLRLQTGPWGPTPPAMGGARGSPFGLQASVQRLPKEREAVGAQERAGRAVLGGPAELGAPPPRASPTAVIGKCRQPPRTHGRTDKG